MSDIGIDAQVSQAVAHLQHGKLAEAEAVFRDILERDPAHSDSNHLLGVIEIQRGQYDAAIEWIARAIRGNPGVSMYYNNYCLALTQAGRFDEALSACERAIQLDPGLPEAHSNHGNVLRRLGLRQMAMAAYEQAIRLRPSYVDAHYERANLMLQAGRGGEAEPAFRRVLELNPQHAVAWNNLAVALVGSGKLEEALVASGRAIELAPNSPQPHNCRADALKRLSRLEEALRACEKAIDVMPDDADSHNNRGNILLEAGQIAEAEASYRRARELKPDDARFHSNLLFVQAARADLPFNEMLEALRGWDRVHGQEGRRHPLSGRNAKPVSEKRLRIGYVSPHLRTHVIAFFIEPLFASHDRSRFEIYCYASFPESRADATSRRLQGLVKRWRFVSDRSDEELARLIHEDGIDILVDLAGHTSNNRLKAFTWRPAPVQATYLGFFAGTGLSAMDYWITDEVLHPRDTPELAVERIYRLPRCWVCYQPPPLATEISPGRTAREEVVFGSFNQLSKLSPGVIETWSTILRDVPGSRLLVMAKSLADPAVRSMLLARFARHGIAQDRLILRKGESYGKYFSTFAEVDIALDPFPRTGGTTTAETLWMGVPVVTLAGQRYVQRISASKLAAVGLDDLIARSREEYADKAISLAHDPARRAELRKNLRARMAQSPLCDGAGLARAMEAAYRDMWQRHLSGAA